MIQSLLIITLLVWAVAQSRASRAVVWRRRVDAWRPIGRHVRNDYRALRHPRRWAPMVVPDDLSDL
jgi:hypothetical protein